MVALSVYGRINVKKRSCLLMMEIKGFREKGGRLLGEERERERG
jgi:hypothetical protein